MDVTVAIATYGEAHWAELAINRAWPTAAAQNVPIVVVHGSSLCDARNRALAAVTTEWVCYLDADDELESSYFDHMSSSTADVRAPAVRYIVRGHPAPPAMPRVAGHRHNCTSECLAYGNWLIVGSVARTGLLRQVGGWHDFPWSEDWDLWVRCWKAGATIEAVPHAVYRAHVRPDSRNRAPAPDERLAAHRLIAEANGLAVPA